MGVEGDKAVKEGTQEVAALNKDTLEEIEKQRRNTSAEANISVFSFVISFSLSVISWFAVLFTWNALRSLNSHISNLVLLLPTK
jgi:hypothetical protein